MKKIIITLLLSVSFLYQKADGSDLIRQYCSRISSATSSFLSQKTDKFRSQAHYLPTFFAAASVLAYKYAPENTWGTWLLHLNVTAALTSFAYWQYSMNNYKKDTYPSYSTNNRNENIPTSITADIKLIRDKIQEINEWREQLANGFKEFEQNIKKTISSNRDTEIQGNHTWQIFIEEKVTSLETSVYNIKSILRDIKQMNETILNTRETNILSQNMTPHNASVAELQGNTEEKNSNDK